jgi:hypothetical protein
LEGSINANKNMRVISMNCILEIMHVCNVEDLVAKCEVLQESIRLGSVDRDGQVSSTNPLGVCGVLHVRYGTNTLSCFPTALMRSRQSCRKPQGNT